MRDGETTTTTIERLETMTKIAKAKTVHENRFYNCPGAWVGNMPGDVAGSFLNRGHIVVDSEMVVPAIKFLSRFYVLTGSQVSRTHDGVRDGLLIRLETKGREYIQPATLESCGLAD